MVINAAHSQPAFSIEKVTDRIYVASQEKSARVDVSCSIVVGDNFVTVFDATSNEASAKVLIQQIKRQVTDKPVKHLILSHAHVDNALGAAAFRDAYPGLSIIMHKSAGRAMTRLEAGAKAHAADIDRRSKLQKPMEFRNS